MLQFLVMGRTGVGCWGGGGTVRMPFLLVTAFYNDNSFFFECFVLVLDSVSFWCRISTSCLFLQLFFGAKCHAFLFLTVCFMLVIL